jgi:hypothetical protein
MYSKDVKRYAPRTMGGIQVAISTSPSAPVWDEDAAAATSPSFPAGFDFGSSFMNESNSLSNSSAVLGFLGPGRGGLVPLVRIAPAPRGLRLKRRVRRQVYDFGGCVTHGAVGSVFFPESPSLSNKGGFEILSISDVGALAARRLGFVGIGAYSTVII